MRPYSNDLRDKVIQAYKRGDGPLREIAHRFSVSLNFVWLLWQRYLKTGSVDPKPHGGGPTSVMNEERLALLRELIEEKNDATLVELRDRFNEKTGLKVSRGTISRALNKLNITRKKKTFHATEREKNDDIRKEREEFLCTMPDRDARELVFVDESGINLGMARRYGRAPAGKRAEGHRPCDPGQNITLIGALSIQGVGAVLMFPGSLNGDIFKTYLEQVLVPQLKPDTTVLLDRLPAHRVSGGEELLKKAEAKIEFLPRYSPDFSPIEHAWSKIKEELRTVAARNYDALVQAVKEALNKVSSSDARGWFEHCGYCIEPA